MAKYCGRCGRKLDEQTGRCPVCDAALGNAGGQKRQEKDPDPKKNRKPQNPRRKRRVWPVILAVVLVLAVVGGYFLFGDQGMDLFRAFFRGANYCENNPSIEAEGCDTSVSDCYIPQQENIIYDEDSGTEYVNNIILIFFHPDASEEEISEVIRSIDGEQIGKISGINQYQVEIAPRTIEALEELCEQVTKMDPVKFAIIDNVVSAELSQTPNDPWKDTFQGISGVDWDESNPSGQNWWLEATKVLSAWEYSEDMATINVGIVDSGYDTNHEDLSITVLNPDVNTPHDHGTHVAGVIGATVNNRIGISGILENVNLYGVDCYASGVQKLKKVTVSTLMSGIDSCLENQCKVINLSSATKYTSKNETEKNAESNASWALQYLLSFLDSYDDFIIVQAAGNGNSLDCGVDAGKYGGFFASIEEQDVAPAIQELKDDGYTFDREISAQDVLNSYIIVGAVDNEKKNDDYQLAKFSNYGASISVCAPGVDIFSTVVSGGLNGSYGYKDGTSMAAPIVSGITAMVWAINPDMSAAEVKDIVCSTATTKVLPRWEKDRGTYTMVNAQLAVEEAIRRNNTEEESQGEAVDFGNIPSEAQEFNGHYYLICSPNQVTTWEEAAAYCQDLGGYLATITSQEENTFLTSLITGAGRRSAYIGLSDKEEEGTWTWVTGEAFSYQNWRGTEPNNDDGDEYYVMVYDDGSWNDANFIYEEGRPSERNVQCYVKAKDDSLNLRAEPKYESDLAHEVTSGTTLMKFYGQIQQGLGSDGQMHDWYKVYIGSYVSGWARSDLIKQVDQKSVQGNDGVAFICEWGPYAAEETTGNDPSTPGGSGSGASSSARDVVLVLDVSGSMSGTPMEETKTAAVRFVETVLQENARIGIVTYDSQAVRIADFSANEAQLEQAIQSINSGGSTDIEAGLQEAHAMLAGSQADKKILVLMSDGEPNEGRVGDELVDYADTIKAQGVRIYTLGFFESLSNKSEAQSLMERIATDGCHYEVASAEDLVFFFGDMADQINGQKYIYVRIACPVDVSVTYNGETLNSSENNQNLRTAFGTLTFEENDEALSEGADDRVKVLRLKEGIDYDLELVGTGRGIMNYTIGFMDEAGEYSDLRKFENVKITKNTEIDTVAGVSSESVLNIDEDGDGKYDLKLRAGENGYGEEVVIENWVYLAVICACILVLIDVILIIVLKNRKRKKGR